MSSSLLLRSGLGCLQGLGTQQRKVAACARLTAATGTPRVRIVSPFTAAPKTVARRSVIIASQPEGEGPVVYNKEFGYSRKDVIIITFGLIALGYGLYYGLQAMGMEAGYAGNWVQFIIFMGICVGWISTYLFRVATKQMTYVKQLEQYEEAVMKKRLDEMTEEEYQNMIAETEQERLRRESRKQ